MRLFLHGSFRCDSQTHACLGVTRWVLAPCVSPPLNFHELSCLLTVSFALLHQYVITGIRDNSFIVFTVLNTTEDGWIIYNDTQYFINTDKVDMESARRFCRKNFGDLVVITGESERKFLWKQARNYYYYFSKFTKNFNIGVWGLLSCNVPTDSKRHRRPVLYWHDSEFG